MVKDNYASIHRFHDLVCLYVSNREESKSASAYFTADQARRIGQALITFADDVDARKYLESTLSTFETEEPKR